MKLYIIDKAGNYKTQQEVINFIINDAPDIRIKYSFVPKAFINKTKAENYKTYMEKRHEQIKLFEYNISID